LFFKLLYLRVLLFCATCLVNKDVYKVQKFSSGTGSPGWCRKKGRKTFVVVWCGGVIVLLVGTKSIEFFFNPLNIPWLYVLL